MSKVQAMRARDAEHLKQLFAEEYEGEVGHK